jgi:hypothetical protein
MKGGLAQIVGGTFQTLDERKDYRPPALQQLVLYLDETLPTIMSHLTPASRKEMMLRLEKMQEDPTKQDLQPGLQQLQFKVKAAVEAASAP